MKKILRKLSFALASTLYSFIPDLYNIFYKLSCATYIDQETIRGLSRNIYVVVSACMLFALGIRLLTAIVNPDSFNDNKKGAKKTFMNCIIAVILIAIVPIGFEKAYDIQNTLIGNEEDSGNNLIATLFLGKQISENDSIGEILAKQSFVTFCYPNDYRTEEVTDSFNTLTDNYTEENMDNVGDVINNKNDGHYEIDYNILLSPAFGFYMVYQMLLLCLDVATRAIRLVVLEMMAPLVICAFIFSGTEVLQKWFKDVLSTYIIIFAKIVAIIFTIFGMQQMGSIMDGSNFSGLGFIGKGIAKAAVIIALLTIVKQLPTMINNIFGTNIQDQGGIGGRLGNMAGIGSMAQNAWNSIRQNPLRAVAAPASFIGGAVAHTAAATVRAVKRGAEVRDNIRTYGGSRRAGRWGGIAAAGAGIFTGFLGSNMAALRAARSGFQNGNMRGIGEQYKRFNALHPEHSTFLGRAGNMLGGMVGIDSGADLAMQRWEKNNDNYSYYDPTTGKTIQFGTLEEMNRTKSDMKAKTKQNVDKNRELDKKINGNQNNVIGQAKYIKDRCDEKNMEETSKVKVVCGEMGVVKYKDSNNIEHEIDVGAPKNLYEYQKFIDSYAAGTPKKEDYKLFDQEAYDEARKLVAYGAPVPDVNDFYTKFDEDAYNAAVADHTAALSALGADFKNKKENDAREQYILRTQLNEYNPDGTKNEWYIGDSSITNAISVMEDYGRTVAESEGVAYVSMLGADNKFHYDVVDSRDKKAKGDNNNYSTQKSINDNEISEYQNTLQQIEQAEAAHKDNKEAFEASDEYVRMKANKNAADARRGQNNNNNSGN